eukprot:94295-Rhodomonas_salina.1
MGALQDCRQQDLSCPSQSAARGSASSETTLSDALPPPPLCPLVLCIDNELNQCCFAALLPSPGCKAR